MDTFTIVILVLVSLFVLYKIAGIVIGRARYGRTARELEEEGIVLAEEVVFTRFNFPMIKRITFTRLVLTRHRFVALGFLSRSQLLQAPVGATGAAGTDKGSFEAEKKGGKARLLLRATIRGGGKIRFHVKDAREWVDAIRRC